MADRELKPRQFCQALGTCRSNLSTCSCRDVIISVVMRSGAMTGPGLLITLFPPRLMLAELRVWSTSWSSFSMLTLVPGQADLEILKYYNEILEILQGNIINISYLSLAVRRVDQETQ